MKTFIETADSRETSKEIMERSCSWQSGDSAEAVRIWEEPTEAETACYLGSSYAKTHCLQTRIRFFWGCDGSKWADSIKMEDE